MANRVTLEQVEQLAAQLPPPEQLRLMARICEQLSTMPMTAPTVVDEEAARRQREREANELLALCDAAAEMWEGEFDAVQEIQQMRRERDEQIWPSRSQRPALPSSGW